MRVRFQNNLFVKQRPWKNQTAFFRPTPPAKWTGNTVEVKRQPASIRTRYPRRSKKRTASPSHSTPHVACTEDAWVSGTWLFDTAPNWLASGIQPPLRKQETGRPLQLLPISWQLSIERMEIEEEVVFESGAWLFEPLSAPWWLLNELPEVFVSTTDETKEPQDASMPIPHPPCPSARLAMQPLPCSTVILRPNPWCFRSSDVPILFTPTFHCQQDQCHFGVFSDSLLTVSLSIQEIPHYVEQMHMGPWM